MPQKKAIRPPPKTKAAQAEKQDEQRFTLTFDEFFKIGMKVFFTEFGYDVQSEVELFKLPKKLDILLLQQGKTKTPIEFTLLNYFKKYNLVSYKSPRDRIREKDIRDAVIYLNGYINMTKEANYNNTTISLFCNHEPKKFLKENKANVKWQSSGYWQINYGLFTVHLLNLNQTELNGLESLFLKDFADVSALRAAYKTLQEKEKVENVTNVKIVDMIQQFIYYRAYGLDTSLLKEFEMPNTAEIDITDIVKPHYEKGLERGLEQGLERGLEQGLERGLEQGLERGLEQGLEQGIEQGIEQGLARGAYQERIEAARKMLARGYDINEICELTSLTRKEVAKLSQKE